MDSIVKMNLAVKTRHITQHTNEKLTLRVKELEDNTDYLQREHVLDEKKLSRG